MAPSAAKSCTGLLERAHLFVSASSYEGFGLSTIEAMSAATVVVVTAVGAHPDVVRRWCEWLAD